MPKITQFLQEGDGQFSATRLGFLLWVIGVLIVWVIDSLISKTLQPIPEQVQVLIGILMTGKVVQRFGENGASNSDAKPE